METPRDERRGTGHDRRINTGKVRSDARHPGGDRRKSDRRLPPSGRRQGWLLFVIAFALLVGAWFHREYWWIYVALAVACVWKIISPRVN